MEISIVLIALGALIFCSHIFNSAFSKTRIPNVLLLMISGLLVGPIFGWVSPSDLGKVGSVFTTVTLICILFQSGTSLDLKTLYRSIGPASFITVLNFIVMMAIGVILGLLMLKLNVIQSCFLGAALGGTSAAVVIPMVNQLKP
ncbi:MAG: sodium:proton exchanger, partial [Bacteroidales bacterium]|nr:sodium:proton exchanger [Bacteroidales bacterium]